MSKESPSNSPSEDKKESYIYATSGHPCGQDTNPAAMPRDKIDVSSGNRKEDDELPLSDTRDSTKPGNEQQDDNDLPPSQAEPTTDIQEHHTQPFSMPHDNQQTPRCSDIKGEPVVEGEPNAEGVELTYLRLSSYQSSSTDTSGYLDLSAGSSQLSGLQSTFCSTCKLLMQKSNCNETKEFWKDIDHEGPDDHQSCHIKFFEKFLEKLRDKFPQEEGLKSKCTINLLKHLLKIDLKDLAAGVRLVNLQRIVDLFGPVKLQDERCVLIHQIHEIVKKSMKVRERERRVKSSWFVGDMTREEAENLLLAPDCKDKTYLVRISSSDGNDGDFVLSVRHEDHCHHLKIQGDPKMALAESHYSAHMKFAGREFASLPEVVDYVVRKQEIEIDQEDESEDEQSCKSVTCLRVFPKSPLNGPMSGYERTKR